MNFLRKITRILFWSLVLWVFTHVFLFQICKVPTASMRGSLLEGDYVVVNKLALGARIPITPLSLHLGNRHFFLDWLQLPYYRLPGYSRLQRNDIVVFNLPADNDQLPVDEKKDYVKRCIGLPGEIICIRKGKVMINNGTLEDPRTMLQWYSLGSADSDTGLLKRMDPTYQPRTYGGRHDLFITARQADTLQKQYHLQVTRMHISPGTYSPGFFPNSSLFKWNPDSLGPLYIPKKGQSIRLSKPNLVLYQRLIEVYEHNAVLQRNDSVFVNKRYASTYTFKMNYYFMMGDNRYHSIDSRFWGLVPEDHLIGRISGIF